MRRVLFVLMACAGIGACAGPRQWEKTGADREMARQDLRDCRRAASNEAWRTSPDNVPQRYPSPSAHLRGRADPYFSRRDNDRVANESRLIGFCMRNKGYELNASPTELSPPSRPR